MHLIVFITDGKRLTSNQISCLKICKICKICSGMAIRSPGCSIWMKLLCDSSFRRAEPLNSVAAEQFQENRSFTVTLAVAADGKKLPPSVIFKGVRTPRDLAVPDTVRVSFHKKDWMDEKGRNLSHFYFIAHW